MAKNKAALKTAPNKASVAEFIKSVPDEAKRKDAEALLKMMNAVTKEKPVMWGASIVGYGNYVYESPTTGRTGDWFMVGFSPRKTSLTVYIMPGLGEYKDLLKDLGKHKSGGSCLYINKLSDVDEKALKGLITKAFGNMKKKYSKKS